MPSLIELVERINGGESLDAHELAAYQDSTNSAERFLAHHAGATLGLRACHGHLYEALKAIDFADRKVLEQYVGLCGFLGRDEMKTAPMVHFGRSAIERGEVAVGLEAVAHAAAADLARGGSWTTDLYNGQEIARIYQRAAEAIGWTPCADGWSNTQTRIAYLVSGIGDDEPAARAAAAFARTLDQKQYRLGVYSTEAFCRRDRQQFGAGAGAAASADVPVVPGSLKRGAATIARMKEAKAGVWIAPTAAPAGGDVVGAATALADQLVADQADVLIIDADPCDPIAGLLCHWSAAKSVLWIARRLPLYTPALDAVAYLDPLRLRMDEPFWQEHEVPCTSFIEGVDLEAPVAEAPRRSAYGLPDSAVILTTAADDVMRTITPLMVDTIIDVLKRHPQAVYLLAGGGDAGLIRRRFEAAGVGKRVGYAGKRRDLPGFLKMADVYLAEFPEPATAGVLQAMSMSLPVVAMAGDEGGPGAGTAELVGSEAIVPAQDVAAYAERISRLVRDANLRQQQGRNLRRRVEQSFAFSRTTRSLEKICARLVQDETQAASGTTAATSTSVPSPVRKAA